MTADIKHDAFPRPEADRTFYACYPHPRFPILSITGDDCALRCKHCGRRYLRHMISCSSPDALLKKCVELAANDARGVLLSGGYNSEGYVPFEPFLDAVERVKRETKLFISAHTGLVPCWLAHELGRVGVDLADFDLIGDDDTIALVLGVDRTVDDYRRAMSALKQSLPHVSPHICIGLHAGELRGESMALDMALEAEPSVVVLLVLTPTPGAEFGGLTAPSIESVENVVAEARSKFPHSQLALGCMRPRDSKRVDFELAALRAGVDRMEIPSEQTLEAAHKLGFQVLKLNACCSVPNELAGAPTWSST